MSDDFSLNEIFGIKSARKIKCAACGIEFKTITTKNEMEKEARERGMQLKDELIVCHDCYINITGTTKGEQS